MPQASEFQGIIIHDCSQTGVIAILIFLYAAMPQNSTAGMHLCSTTEMHQCSKVVMQHCTNAAKW